VEGCTVKILLVGEFSAYGGAKTYFRYLVEFYKRKNFQVILAITARQLDSEIQALVDGRQTRLMLLPDRGKSRLKLRSYFPFSIPWDIYRVARGLRERPNVIVVSAASAGSFLGLMLLPYKFLYIAHACAADTSGNSVKSRIGKWLHRIFFRLLAGKNKQIVAVSQFEKEVLAKRWMRNADAKWINVVHNTSMLACSSIKPKHHQGSSKIRILTLGLVAWTKNPMVWVEVAKHVLESVAGKQDIEFCWAGDGDLLAECREKIQHYGISESVRFIGFQSEVEILYEDCDIYFQPSRLESHGMAVVDAMRFGLPCVVSRIGGLPESVEDGITGFVVDVDNIREMADRLVELANSVELRARMGEAAVRRYSEYFSPAEWDEKMMRLHHSLAE
jgi:glycosyltransferase involved in cell wall biosynthesis